MATLRKEHDYEPTPEPVTPKDWPSLRLDLENERPLAPLRGLAIAALLSAPLWGALYLLLR